MTGAFFCSECGYENVVAGCGFCLQCGAEFNAADQAAINQESEAREEKTENAAPSAQVPEAVPTSVSPQNAQDASPENETDSSPVVPQVDPALRGGTIDFQTALATAEQRDFENESDWEEADQNRSEAPVAVAADSAAQTPAAQAPAAQTPAAPVPPAAVTAADVPAAVPAPQTPAPQPTVAPAQVAPVQAPAAPTPMPAVAATPAPQAPVAEAPAVAIPTAQAPAPVANVPSPQIPTAAVPLIQIPTAVVAGAQPSQSSAQPTRVTEENGSTATGPAVAAPPVESGAVESGVVESGVVESGAEAETSDEFSEVLDEVPVPEVAQPPEQPSEPVSVAPVEPEEGEPEETFAESLQREMHAAIVSAAGLVNMRVREEGGRLIAQLLIDGRPQLVFIERSLNSYQTPILSVFAVCGPVSPENAMPLLEWNRALNLCSFAVREVGEKRMFVIQSNVLAYAIDQALLSKTLLEIAKRANQVNERLIG